MVAYKLSSFAVLSYNPAACSDGLLSKTKKLKKHECATEWILLIMKKDWYNHVLTKRVRGIGIYSTFKYWMLSRKINLYSTIIFFQR